MKKILFGILSFGLFLTGVSAKEINSQFKSEFLGKYHYVDQNGKFGDFEAFLRTSDLSPAYCIEPGIPLSKDTYNGYYDLPIKELASKVNLTEDQLQTVSLISYYGYDSFNNDVSWRVATQAYIWEVIGRKFQFTSKNSEKNPWAYVISTPPEIQKNMNRIKMFVNEAKTLPALNNQTITISYGKTYKFIDSNNRFPSYNITNTSNGKAIRNGTVIEYTPNEEGQGSIEMEHIFSNKSNSITVYHHADGQDLLLDGNPSLIKAKINFNIVSGSISLTKLDKDTNTCNKEVTKAVYGLYEEDNTFLKEITLNNCQITIDHLKFGNYYIKEIQEPNNYQLDNNKYHFTINNSNYNKKQNITLYDELIKKKVTIHKEYQEDGKNYNEPKSDFIIINQETKEENKVTTNEEGMASITLPIGNYIIRQIQGKENYHLIKEHALVITKDSHENILLNFTNEPYLTQVHVQKIEKETNRPISLANIKFKLYDLNQKKQICETENCLYVTNEKGAFTTKGLPVSTYSLEEIDQTITGYLRNKEPLIFTITKNTGDELFLSFQNIKEPIVIPEIPTPKQEEKPPVVPKVIEKEIVYLVPNTYLNQAIILKEWTIKDDQKKHYYSSLYTY